MTTRTTRVSLADPGELSGTLDPMGVPYDDARAADAVARASSRFISAVRHPVVRVTDDVRVFDGTGTKVMHLPVLRPDVTRVEILDRGEFRVISDYQVSGAGLMKRESGWPHGYANIRVTMSHGLDPIPDEIQDAVLESAATMRPRGVKDLSLDGARIQFDSGVSQEWSDVVELYRIQLGDRA